MQQKAAVLFPAALVHELVGVPVLVQPVEALVQRDVYKRQGDAFAPRNHFALNIDDEVDPPMFKISDTHYARCV